MSKYTPEYAKGEILVNYKSSLLEMTEGFAITFGRALGYTMIGGYEHGDPAFIYETEPGKEDEAIKKFIKREEFIDGASRRDIKMEKRWKNLEEAIDMVRTLHDNVELPDPEYKKELDTIVSYLKELNQ